MPHAATNRPMLQTSAPVRPSRLRKRQIFLLVGAGVIDIASRVVLARLTAEYAPQLVALVVSFAVYGF